jgi:hypothetical protein
MTNLKLSCRKRPGRQTLETSVQEGELGQGILTKEKGEDRKATVK